MVTDDYQDYIKLKLAATTWLPDRLAFNLEPTYCSHPTERTEAWTPGTLHRYCCNCGVSGKIQHMKFTPYLLEDIIMAASTKKAEPTVTRVEIRFVPDEKLGDMFMPAMLGQP